MARSQFSYEKRRKELEKKKKKEAKREAREARKVEGDPGGAPVVEIDEWGNAVAVEPDQGEMENLDKADPAGE